jgi:hypothetical protein
LALESFDLLRYILKLSFSEHSSLGDLVSGAIRSAHCGPDFHCDSRESALSGHVYPPHGTHAILYHNPDYAIFFLESCDDRADKIPDVGERRRVA